MSADPPADFNIDGIARPIVTFHAMPDDEHWEQDLHRHAKAQLVYSVRGIVHCEVETGIWIVPPQCAVWVPPDHLHRAWTGAGGAECYTLFVSPEAIADLPQMPCTLSVSPLFRELMFATAGLAKQHVSNSREGRRVAALLDEIAAAPIEEMHIPMPRDPRLKDLAVKLMNNPADKITLETLASWVGLSKSSFCRLFLEECGMSFGQWRRQLHITLAIQWISKGMPLQTVALDLGYESSSSFVTMFRKVLGKPPMSYVADRIFSASSAE